ncbi:hypothetical protein G5O_0227 [Chlamydia psittaci 6BC]|nr:hypothetical protein G5O_0227 [Chlamydia psittaci 6BC]
MYLSPKSQTLLKIEKPHFMHQQKIELPKQT